jgi:hypothetical protein
MQIPSDLFTTTSLLTLQGSAVAVFIITSILGYLLPNGKNIKLVKIWTALVLSIALGFLGLVQVSGPTILNWFVAFFNGCLIFLTAIGGNAVTSSGGNAVPASGGNAVPAFSANAKPQKVSGFRDRWF